MKGPRTWTAERAAATVLHGAWCDIQHEHYSKRMPSALTHEKNAPTWNSNLAKKHESITSNIGGIFVPPHHSHFFFAGWGENERDKKKIKTLLSLLARGARNDSDIYEHTWPASKQSSEWWLGGSFDSHDQKLKPCQAVPGSRPSSRDDGQIKKKSLHGSLTRRRLSRVAFSWLFFCFLSKLFTWFLSFLYSTITPYHAAMTSNITTMTFGPGFFGGNLSFFSYCLGLVIPPFLGREED